MGNAIGAAYQSDAITSFTDSSGGTASNAVAAGVGRTFVTFFMDLPTIADGDLITTFTPGFAGKILAVDFIVHAAVTTASKASTLNVEIGTTNLTGGAVSLTSAAATPAGKEIAGTAVTANNSFTSTDTISVEAASTTTFIEGSGWLVLTLQNTDAANAFASMSSKVNELLTNLRDAKVIKNASS